MPEGAGDRFSVSAAGLEAHREHNLHTVVLNNRSAAFNRGCTTFRESDSIVGHTSAIEYYTVYGCVAPSALIWSYVEEVGGTTLASSGVLDNEVDIADPKVSFEEPSSYDVNEEDRVAVTVKLSHPSSHNIDIPITFGGTADSSDYYVEGLSSDNKLSFKNRSESEEFTIVARDEDDFVNETVELGFGTLPSTVMGTESPSSATVTIIDDDENSPPYIATRIRRLNFDECGEGTVETYSATDPDDHPLTWSLQSSSSYPDRRDFNIEDDELSDDGILTFDNAPDFEDPDDSDGNNEYKIMIRVRDDYGGSDERNVTVNVTNLKPTITSGPERQGYAEGGTNQVARFVASDPCGGDITWSLSGTDAGDFRLSQSGVLTFKVPPDYENPGDGDAPYNVYDIVVAASDRSDGTGLSDEREVTVTVTNLPPTISSGSGSPSYDEGGAGPVATYVASDPGGGDITWSLLGTDEQAFRISQTGVLTFKAPPDFENPVDAGRNNEYSITVIASDTDDSSGLSAERNVTVRVMNLPPTIVPSSSPVNYDEGGMVPVATYVASDPGGGDISWSLRGVDAGDLRISQGGVFTFRSPPDHEDPHDDDVNNDYEIIVRASDASGSTAVMNVTVNVIDVNESPEITVPRLPGYDENRTDAVATFTAEDPEGDAITWSLPDTTHATDRDDFQIDADGELNFVVSPDFESPHDSNGHNDYKVTIEASDGSLSTSVHVTITVADVNEIPEVDSEIADQTMTGGDTTMISLQGTFSDPDTNDTLTYSASASPSGIATAIVNNTDSTLTLAALSAGSATITVTAADRSPGHADRMEASQDFMVTVDPLPTVTITRKYSAVDEGDPVVFTVWADAAPTSALTVNVRVSDVGTFLTGTRPSQVTIADGSLYAQFTLRTAGDDIDEANGTVTAIVRFGADYIVGSPSSAVVTVRDDDKPPVPTGLRANGDLDSGGNVTLRWNAVAGATSYEVQYAEETCTRQTVVVDGNEVEQANCTLGSWSMPITATSTDTTLGGLTEATLYRVQVRAVIADASSWSDFTLVFPTDSPIVDGTEVATAPFHGYQAKNERGNHEFRYVVCEETVPAGLTMSVRDMKDAVEKWEDTVTWDMSGGANIIKTTAYTLPAGEGCSSSVLPGKQDFEIKFFSDLRMKLACNLRAVIGIDPSPPACWRSTSWTTSGIQLISKGSVLLNTDRGATHWNTRVAGGRCARLHETIVHEIGHALGIGNTRGFDYNRHPVNTEHSVMSYRDDSEYCEPQAYDIVALMALYQSR